MAAPEPTSAKQGPEP
jgi:hypothetical protein